MRNDIPLKNRALTLIERLRQPLVDPVFWSGAGQKSRRLGGVEVVQAAMGRAAAGRVR